MTQRFDELAAQRGPLYAAMQPVGEFKYALKYAEASATAWAKGQSIITLRHNQACATHLLFLAIRALRNQGQPYYHTEAQP